MKMKIAPATKEDLPILQTLIQEFADHQGDQSSCNQKQLELGLFSTSPSAEVILIKEGDDVCGYALFYPTFSSYHGTQGLYLEDLYIRTKWQKNGFGRAVMRYIAKIVQERGYCRFTWNVKDWNEKGISFYQRLDATESSGKLSFSLEDNALKQLIEQ